MILWKKKMSIFIEPIYQTISRYYGLDWLSFLFLILGMWLVSQKKYYGFIFSIFGCLCGVTVSIMAGIVGWIIMDLTLATIYTIAWWNHR